MKIISFISPILTLSASLIASASLAAAPPEADLTPDLNVDYVEPSPKQPDASSFIFKDDFNDGTDLKGRYYEYDDAKGSFVWTKDGGYGGGGGMKCQFEKGQVEAGALRVLFGRNPLRRAVHPDQTYREIYWRVYVKHEAGWQGNPAKLARATCLTENWSQGFIAHVWGGKGDCLCIDPASGIRDSRKVSTKYNDFDHLRWLGLRDGTTPIFSPKESGRWVLVESHVKLNSPGKSDGVFELRIDGKPEAARYDLDWHGTWNDWAVDAVFLENYWNQGAAKREARWFDNFAISTARIGPIVAPIHPAIVLNRKSDSPWRAQIASDPDGKDVVWSSREMSRSLSRLLTNAANGAFSGSLSGKTALAKGTIYWIRLSQKRASGEWGEWGGWRSPFQTPGD